MKNRELQAIYKYVIIIASGGVFMEKKEICKKVEVNEKAAEKAARKAWKEEAIKRAKRCEKEGIEPYE